MNCKKCGFPMEDDARQCPFCHTAVQELNTKPVVSKDFTSAATSQTTPAKTTQPAAKTQPRPAVYEYPMKWYKFLIYFSLFASAASSFISAITYFLNAVAISQPGFMVWLGIFSIVLGILSLITRSELAKFKKTGPSKLITLYACNAAINAIYVIIIRVLVGETVASISTLILTIVVNIFMIIANKVYFDKRAALFYN